MRQLASVQRITSIRPIEGADAIECARVLGWDVVVKKGEFAVGDLAVYMEIDSVPPDEEQYRFLWKFADQRPNNFRIKTVKLRGQISQGILFKTDVLGDRYRWGDEVLPPGFDVTDMLGVTKYEPPLPNGSGDVEGQFFDGVPKTDEERVQSAEGAKRLERLRGRPYYITEKLDGSSCTIAMHDGVPKVASRNYRLRHEPDSLYWRAAIRAGALEWIETFPDFAVQGELVGPGIQNNRLGLADVQWFMFSMWDRRTGELCSLSQMLATDLPMVPVVEVGYLFNYTQEQLLTLAEGKYKGTKNEREGIVIRSNDGNADRVSFKAINNKFLLKGGD